MTKTLSTWLNHLVGSPLIPNSVAVRLAAGTFWSGVGVAAEQGFRFIAFVVAARMLGLTGFGELGLITSMVAAFGTFAGLGLGLTATKYIAEHRNSRLDRIGAIITLSLGLAVISGSCAAAIVVMFAPDLSVHLMNSTKLVTPVRLAGGLLLLTTVQGVQLASLAGFEYFKGMAKVNMARGLLHFPAIVLGIYIFGLTGAVGGMLIVESAGVLISYVVLRNTCRRYRVALKIKGMTNELFVLWRFSLPAFLSSTIVSPVIWVANLILANQKEGFAQLALVNASNQVRMVLLVLPTLICTAALPVISSEHTQANGSGGSKEAIDIAQKYSSIIVLPLFSCLVFFAGPIMMLYGPEFLPGSSVFIGIMFATGISAVGSIIGISMASMDRMWAGLGLNVIWAAIFLIVLSQLASKWGANAYAFSFSAAYIVLFSLTNWYQKERMLRITFVRIFISGAYLLGITILCLFTPAEWRLIMLLPVCMATIIFSLWIFNINWNGKRQYGPRKEEGCQ